MNSFSLEPLQVTLNLIPAHTWYANRSGALTFVNERCAAYLGLAKDSPLRFGTETGASWDSHIPLLHPDDHAETRKIWSACLSANSSGDATFRVRNADGGYRWFLSRAEPLWSHGQVWGWIGINLDIEERRQAEFYLAEGQRLGHSGSWAFNTTGFEYWSRGMFQIFGLDAGGKAPDLAEYLARVHPEDREAMSRTIQRTPLPRESLDFTQRIVRPDGEVRRIRYVGTSLSDAGAHHGFVGTAIDVTEQELLTEALRKSEHELRQIVDVTPQLAGVMGPKGERIYANRGALAYFGVTVEEWLRAPSFIHPEDRERHKALEEHLSTGVTQELELRMRRSDGSYRWFLARYQPVLDEHGRLLRWYVACADIDDRKRAEERLQQENVALREEIAKTAMFEEIVGISPALSVVLSRVSKVASSDSTVLITGETGTGKELVARAIHRQSRRASRAFVAVNCAAIPRELVASELFGHEKGAFTGAMQRQLGRFELADGGTLFLDEVGELLPDTQAALLRVLQERQFERIGGREVIGVDVRVVAATNRELEEAVAAGSFRRDLYYRLNVFPIEMPPLRERQDDIPLLIEYFVDQYARKMGKRFKSVNRRTLDRLKSYSWPGNVRELQNVIERSVIVCDSAEFKIDESWLSASPRLDGRLVLPTTLASQEKTMIEEALRACDGRVFGLTGAAARLGIPRSTLESKIRTLKIDKKRFRHRTAKS